MIFKKVFYILRQDGKLTERAFLQCAIINYKKIKKQMERGMKMGCEYVKQKYGSDTAAEGLRSRGSENAGESDILMYEGRADMFFKE